MEREHPRGNGNRYTIKSHIKVENNSLARAKQEIARLQVQRHMRNGKKGSFAVNATISSTIYFSSIFASKDRFLRGIRKKVLLFVVVKN